MIRLFWKEKNVLVTGSSGFIGHRLVQRLLELDTNVTGIDIVKPEETNNDNFHFIQHDITKKMPSVDNIDIIFHLAAYPVPRYCEKNPTEAFRINVQGHHNVLKFVEENNVSKFLFTSSAFLYGNTPEYLPIDENHPIKPFDNVYSITKKIGEDLSRMLEENSKTSVTILRLFNTFGERQSNDYLIPTIIEQAMSDKDVELWSDKPAKDFNYIDNTVDAIILAGESSDSGIFNVGSGKRVKIKELTEYICSKFNKKMKFLDKEILGASEIECNFNKIQTKLGWKPQVELFEGLERTIEWYKNNNSRRGYNIF